LYIHVPYENWRFLNWLKSHLSLAPPFINTMYVTTWPISKRGNKWEMLSYEAWTDGRTAVCHNKPVFWRAYKNEWPISWNYEYIIFGQIIFQNFHQFKAFVGLSDRRIIGLSDYRTIGLSDYSYGPHFAADWMNKFPNCGRYQIANIISWQNSLYCSQLSTSSVKVNNFNN
jgi:hypothetical protein